MAKIHEFPALSARRARTRRHIAWAGVAVVVMLVGAVSHSVTPRDAANANVNRNAAMSNFDYFPSHYVNQATEAAEPIATF